MIKPKVNHLTLTGCLLGAALVCGLSSALAEVPVVSSTPVGKKQQDSQRGASRNSAAGLFFQLEALQQEVQTLRGLVEEQNHIIQRMRQEQKDRYLDLDRRVSQLSGGAVSTSTASTVSNTAADSQLNQTVGSDNQDQASAQADIEKEAYKDAFNLVRQRQYDKAKAAFSALLKQFPQGKYAANAHYWLGEIYFTSQSLDQAKSEFEQIISQFPSSRKAPDAIYKLGRVLYQQGQTDKAKSMLSRVTKDYPNSSAARLASALLQTMR
ncbi:tol-pal system protein YbgF [Spartinivicinus ruber]|uniref:tol-pal system protein YbgF n=1 Tax=Spartinivicinus ruber TaxID=2683272 RepID=UPI0013D7784E|nr:tol-pal system protein YbgF [Spartinivicinus ruber]